MSGDFRFLSCFNILVNVIKKEKKKKMEVKSRTISLFHEFLHFLEFCSKCVETVVMAISKCDSTKKREQRKRKEG